MKDKKSDITRFAEACSCGSSLVCDVMCISEELTCSEIGRAIVQLLDDEDSELLMEVSKRFSKYAKDTMALDLENAAVQEFCSLINKILHCCEKNDWFMN